MGLGGLLGSPLLLGFGELNGEGGAGLPLGGLAGVDGEVGFDCGVGWFGVGFGELNGEGGAGFPVGGLVGVLGFGDGWLGSPPVGFEGGD